MTKYTRLFITFLLAAIAFGAKAQSTATTSSPYSKYGLGDITPGYLPQNIGMGGISTAINKINFYNNINPLNPASYGAINLTTIDVGIYSNIVNLSQAGQKASDANFRLSHVAFAVPITKRSAISFGLLPYSEMGYNYKQTLSRGYTGKGVDTNATNYVYNGDGGLSKAYFGYGFGIGKHFLIGGNVSYIFGNLQQFSSTEIPGLYGTLNSRVEQSNAIGGANFDYGAQYSFDFGDQSDKHLVLGYSASAKSSINSTNTYIVSQYSIDANGVANTAADSVISIVGGKTKIQLPQVNHFGISFQNDGHFIIGADYSIGHWSAFTVSGANAGFQDSKTLNVGGEFTPNINALHNYFARVDYRLGFIYDQSYLNISNTNINRTALTFGLGLPLSPNLTTFYKINFSAELGQRGTTANGLVKENYVNLHLSFVLNDKWFQRYKFE